MSTTYRAREALEPMGQDRAPNLWWQRRGFESPVCVLHLFIEVMPYSESRPCPWSRKPGSALDELIAQRKNRNL